MSNSTLEITTMIGCPLMCNYCPQDNLRDAYGKDGDKYMSLATFKQALANYSPEARIDFSGMSEPWVNPDCTDMMQYCLEQGRRVAVYTTLYNWSREDTDRMAELMVQYAGQFEVFSVHYPDNLGNMKGWKYSEDWEYALRVTQAVCQHANIKTEGMTMSGLGQVHDELSHLGIRLWNWSGHDRAGSLPLEQVKEQTVQIAPRHEVPIRCGKTPRYDQNVVLPNGDVVLCCMDYDNKHVLGNLNTHTIAEIRGQDAFKNLLKENAQDRFSTNSLCRTCTDAVPQR
jgi:radical SAM protein with 4Fe4S-binding SPASM domain